MKLDNSKLILLITDRLLKEVTIGSGLTVLQPISSHLTKRNEIIMKNYYVDPRRRFSYVDPKRVEQRRTP